MSSEALPISPTRFAAALTDLPLSALHLKVLELRNSITHLDYSNEQLRPFAEGTATATTTPSTQPQPPQQTSTAQPNPAAAAAAATTTEPTTGEPDPDCVDAIRENEAVIARMQARIALVRAEVERRGLGWAEFQSAEEREAERAAERAVERALQGRQGVEGGLVNGDGGDGGSGSGGGGGAAAAAVNGTGAAAADGERSNPWRDGTFQTGVIRGGVVQMDEGSAGRAQQGGSLTDEELLRRVEEQMRGLAGNDEDDGEGGLHL